MVEEEGSMPLCSTRNQAIVSRIGSYLITYRVVWDRPGMALWLQVRNLQNQEILFPDWMITSHVT